MRRPKELCLSIEVVLLIILLGVAGLGRAQRAPGAALPAQVDLVPEFGKLGLTPLAQGNRDVCSLFAITALAEFESGRQKSKPSGRLSEEFLIWAANKATGRPGDQAMFYEAVHGLETFGICQAGLMPYSPTANARHEPSAKALENARELAGHWRVHWVRRWNVARPLDEAELKGIKRALASGHPVACGLRWPKVLKGDVLREVPPPRGVFDGHSIVLVGYADDPKQNGGGMFVFRNSAGPGWGEKGYGRMSYAYVRAYANDALWLKFIPGRAEAPLERFEAESMAVIATHRCDSSVQDMAEWGRPMWSGGRQLFCRAQPGGSVTLAFSNRRAGRYRLRVLATAAPDFGVVRVAVDGKHLGPNINLYSGRICPSGSIDLGAIDLTAGRHAVRFTSVGKDSASANVWFGIDAVELAAD
jgi:papain like protease